ncbi:uncharacterized protein HMPREF1541_05824 [Cyphellophora europaea CBS 101466]|uniref:Uncharacterized protein n=1 Tax=Cyphellophora europaea (strain CBS 101466) TaxID=1220924 RepID=W2RV06_CYPE1|nr:uncharacterized protein HMPREF1541_05824 [Cyphellophora europaea CBS 101466]ETN39598.1 hypothetical protein HMPREF1541_05824 [Cyphellophora europaea CBS 101466]
MSQATAPYYADYLPYYIFFLAMCSLYMVIGTTISTRKVFGQLYFQNSNITGPGMRIWVPWMMISTGVRLGLFFHFGDKAWHDATMITFAAPIWYWMTEYFIYKTVLNSQFATSMTFEITAFSWLWLTRDYVTGG